MKQLLFLTLSVTVLALVISGTARANSVMRNDKTIDAELFAVAVGDKIRRECDSISAKMATVWQRARALDKYAQGLGFSRKEIDAYLESKSDQARFKKRRDAWLAQNGVKKGDSESYCRIGRAEIAAKSPIGTLLRTR